MRRGVVAGINFLRSIPTGTSSPRVAASPRADRSIATYLDVVRDMWIAFSNAKIPALLAISIR